MTTTTSRSERGDISWQTPGSREIARWFSARRRKSLNARDRAPGVEIARFDVGRRVGRRRAKARVLLHGSGGSAGPSCSAARRPSSTLGSYATAGPSRGTCEALDADIVGGARSAGCGAWWTYPAGQRSFTARLVRGRHGVDLRGRGRAGGRPHPGAGGLLAGRDARGDRGARRARREQRADCRASSSSSAAAARCPTRTRRC